MTPKEKAKELVERFLKKLPKAENPMEDIIINSMAKQCALICVDREIETLKYFQEHDEIGHYWFIDDKLKELQEVKQEIEKL